MTLESLQRQIKTTEDLRDIVRTMKMLSSVSILQYEQANASLKFYRQNLQDAFQALVQKFGLPQATRNKNQPEKFLYILLGSDNGMVGRFNREIMLAAEKDLQHLNLKPSQVLFLTVGKRLSAMAEAKKWPLSAHYANANSVKAVHILAESLIMNLDKIISREKISHVAVYFQQHGKGTAVKVVEQQIMPFDTNAQQKLKDKPWPTNNIPLIVQKKEQLFSALVRESLLIKLISQLNQSLAAEHFTRMTNMQNAEQNIDKNLAELNQSYQQQRQEQITDELIDVISGVEAMKKKKPVLQ